jgi:hypothetical protein
MRTALYMGLSSSKCSVITDFVQSEARNVVTTGKALAAPTLRTQIHQQLKALKAWPRREQERGRERRWRRARTRSARCASCRRTARAARRCRAAGSSTAPSTASVRLRSPNSACTGLDGEGALTPYLRPKTYCSADEPGDALLPARTRRRVQGHVGQHVPLLPRQPDGGGEAPGASPSTGLSFLVALLLLTLHHGRYGTQDYLKNTALDPSKGPYTSGVWEEKATPGW